MFDSIKILIGTLIQNENHIVLSGHWTFAHTWYSIPRRRLILLSGNKSCFFLLSFSFQDQKIFSVAKAGELRRYARKILFKKNNSRLNYIVSLKGKQRCAENLEKKKKISSAIVRAKRMLSLHEILRGPILSSKRDGASGPWYI